MNRKVKILAASDIHGDVSLVKRSVKKAKKNDVDAVVLCGDLTFFNMEVEGIMKPFKDAGLNVMIIPGNHEPVSTTDFFAKRYGPEVKHLHGYSAVVGHVGLFGFSATSFGFSPQTEDTIEKMLETAHNNLEGITKKIMVVHEPPYGTKLDDIGIHTGSKAVRNSIEKLQPELCLCGHMHETFGEEEMIGSTRVINVGRNGVILEL